MICFPSGELSDAETVKAQFYLAIRSIICKQTKGDAPDAEIMNRVVEEVFEKVMEEAENFKKYKRADTNPLSLYLRVFSEMSSNEGFSVPVFIQAYV